MTLTDFSLEPFLMGVFNLEEVLQLFKLPDKSIDKKFTSAYHMQGNEYEE